MSLGRLYGVPADVSALKTDAAHSAGAAGAVKRHKSTKRNPQAKLHVGSAEDVYGDDDGTIESPDGDGDIDESSPSAYGPGATREQPPPRLTLALYKKAITLILRDYLAVGDIDACLS